MTGSPGPLRRWVLAARLRTLPAAIVPVAVGAAAVRPQTVNWFNTALCAVVALSLQIGTNYSNDYSDGVRGTDNDRVGPFRLTASGLVSARRVRDAAFLTFGLAAIVGLVLASRTNWWLVVVGATAILAGWFYTGGQHPYGYYGFGELFVFIFFGFVATVGTAFVQHGHFVARSWWLALAVGAAACTMLEANNLRDVDGDRAVGKRTLAARLGRTRGSLLVLLLASVIVVGSAVGSNWSLGVVAALLYAPGVWIAFSHRRGRELLILLVISARAQLLLGLSLVITCIVVA